MNAPANSVAVSRAEAKVENMGKPLFMALSEPDHRVRANINAGAVPNEKSAYLSVLQFGNRQKLP